MTDQIHPDNPLYSLYKLAEWKVPILLYSDSSNWMHSFQVGDTRGIEWRRNEADEYILVKMNNGWTLQEKSTGKYLNLTSREYGRYHRWYLGDRIQGTFDIKRHTLYLGYAFTLGHGKLTKAGRWCFGGIFGCGNYADNGVEFSQDILYERDTMPVKIMLSPNHELNDRQVRELTRNGFVEHTLYPQQGVTVGKKQSTGSDVPSILYRLRWNHHVSA